MDAMQMNLVFTVLLLVGSAVQQPGIGAPLGRLVEVDGRTLHIHCTGSGSPTVILEAGASAFAIDWALVQPDIARSNRVCSYDRAGHGWSGARGMVDTAARITRDLHDLLAAAGEKPPFLMVGASFGGIYVRLYQLEHPDQVSGLVLVDPATEDRLFTMFQGRGVAIAELTADQLRTTLPSSGSFPIRQRSPQTGAPFDRLPEELYQLRIKFDQRLIDGAGATISAGQIQESSEGQRAALARLLTSRHADKNPFSEVPVVVLTRGRDMGDGLAETHAALARLAKNSRHTVVSDSGHEVHLFTPSAVILAIQHVSTAIRERAPLPQP
jgi:pimeloyl-ACP methyl ester carboxylesterase